MGAILIIVCSGLHHHERVIPGADQHAGDAAADAPTGEGHGGHPIGHRLRRQRAGRDDDDAAAAAGRLHDHLLPQPGAGTTIFIKLAIL